MTQHAGLDAERWGALWRRPAGSVPVDTVAPSAHPSVRAAPLALYPLSSGG